MFLIPKEKTPPAPPDRITTPPHDSKHARHSALLGTQFAHALILRTKMDARETECRLVRSPLHEDTVHGYTYALCHQCFSHVGHDEDEGIAVAPFIWSSFTFSKGTA